MTLYGDLADSVKWKLCEFVSARPAGGDSNIEYDFALEIIKMVREQIARKIEAEGPWCDNPHHREKGRKSANDCPCYIFAAAIARGK